MENFSIDKLTSIILPGFGAFGRTPRTELSIPIKKHIDQVLISVNGPSDEYINIYPPAFFDEDGNEIPKESIITNSKITSRRVGHENDKLDEELLSNALIHSGREINPALNIKLKKEIFIDKIILRNREDVYHKRSRFINLKAFRSGSLAVSFENSNPHRLMEVFNKLIKCINISVDDLTKLSLHEAAEKVASEIKEYALSGSLDLEYREMSYLLPMFQGVMDPDEYQEAICSSMIVKLLDKKPYAPTRELKIISQFLHSDEAIENSRITANGIANKINNDERKLTLSKHQVHFSRLVERKEAHLDGMQKLFLVFSELGIPLMLSYGTLLGAIREKSFLAHDDDVDLLYVDGATSIEEVVVNQKKLIDKLNAKGIKCADDEMGKNFHVFIDGVSLDLFPCWQEGNRTFLLMEQMKYRDISTEIVLPTSSADMHGRNFPAPADPEGFLSERYGAGWKTPDIYYGWPWKVDKK